MLNSKNCSWSSSRSSQVESSVNKSDHLISLTAINLSFFYIILRSKISIRFTPTLAYSSVTGNVEDTTALFLIFFFNKETWNTGWILIVVGNKFIGYLPNLLNDFIWAKISWIQLYISSQGHCCLFVRLQQ